MVKKEYTEIIIESYIPKNTSGKHGKVHARPLANQSPFEVDMDVACSHILRNDYPIGTKFKVKATINLRQGKGDYVYTNYTWPFDIVSD